MFPKVLGRLLNNEKEPITVPKSFGSMVKDRESGSELRGRIWVSLYTTLTKNQFNSTRVKVFICTY